MADVTARRTAMRALTLGSLMTLATVTGAVAQRRPAADDVVVPPTKSHPTVGRSDQHRVVGKVVDVDQRRSLIKLATEDQGVVEVAAPAMMIKAVRVGETVSVPRGDNSPSASPR